LEISIPAKINLWLEVLRKRDDGYHELSSLMLPVGIHDHLDVDLRPEQEGISLACEQQGVPDDARNLAWRAAEAYMKAAGVRTGVRIRLVKNIPVSAGLGGGSADAAAVLLSLNRLLGDLLSMDRLHGLGRQIGADVPFFLNRRPALATGIGEKLREVEDLPPYPLVLIKPPVAISTRWVYRSLKLTRGESRISLSALLTHPWRLQDVMENDLETVTIHEYPQLAQIKEWLLGQGALGALMSGSGPTVFGVFAERGQALRVEMLARDIWKKCWVAAVEVMGSGAAG